MSRGARSGWSACLVIGLVLGIGFVFVSGVGVVGLVVFLRTRPVAAGAMPDPGVETPPTRDDPPGDPPSEAPSTDEPSPDFTLKTSFTPYTVSGRTASEIRSDLSSKGPLDSSGRHDAF